MKKSSNLKSFAALTAFSVTEKVIAFVYQAIIAAVLGASVVTDCFYSASQLYDLIDNTVLGALVVVVINRYANISAEKGDKAGIDFVSSLHSILAIAMVTLSAVVFIFAKPFSYLIAPGFDENARAGLVTCMRYLSVIPPIMTFAVLAQGVLRLKKAFIVANSRSLFISFCGMAVVLLFSTRDPQNMGILCYGYIAANVLYSALLFMRTRPYGVIKYKKPVFDDDMKKLFAMAGPAIISKGIARISLMIDQIISTTLGNGSVSCLVYAHSLYYFVQGVLIVNLCVIMLTDFTNLSVSKSYEKMINKLRGSASSIMLLLAPVTLITLCFSREIVSVAYERGAFSAESAQIVSTLLFCYALGFVSMMLNSLHTQVLHAFGAMKTAMRNSLVSFGLNIVLSIIFSLLFGMAGITLATTVSVTAVIPLFKNSVRKYLPGYQNTFDRTFLIKLAAGLAGCGGVIMIPKLLISSPLLSFATATIAGFTAFGLILILLKEENVMLYMKKIIKKG